MALEERSGSKKLLKLLLDKTSEVLSSTEANTREIELLKAEQIDTQAKLILLIKQLELISGEEDFGTN